MTGAAEAVTQQPRPLSSSPSTQVPGPVAQGALALLLYLVIFIVAYAVPLLTHLSLPQVLQASPDPNFYVWSLRWWPYALIHAHNPLYSSQIGAPAGFNLSWTSPTAAVAILLAPVTELFGPIVSFNLALVLAAPVSGWAAFLAARRLTGRFWAALAAGGVYGFAWYEVGETAVGHLNICVIMLPPLMVYLGLLWHQGKIGSRVFVALLALAMAAEFYVFNETFFWLTVLAAAVLAGGYALARPAQRPQVARLALLAGVAWVLALVLASPYLVYSLRHVPASGFNRAQLGGVALDLRQLVSPDPWSGVVLLVVALGLAVFYASNRMTWLLIGTLVLTIVLSLGPNLAVAGHVVGALPWHEAWNLPFLRSTEPLRNLIFANLALAMIVAVWLAAEVRNKLLAGLRWAVVLVALGGMIAFMPKLRGNNDVPSQGGLLAQPTQDLPVFISSGEYRRYLHRGETVIVVSERGNAGMLFQADMNFYVRLAGGFVNSAITSPSALPKPVGDLEKPSPASEHNFRKYVGQAHVGAVLVEEAWAAPWTHVFSAMGMHGTSVGGVTIYRT